MAVSDDGNAQLKTTTLHPQDPASVGAARQRKHFVVGGSLLLALLVAVGVVAAVTLPLTLGKSKVHPAPTPTRTTAVTGGNTSQIVTSSRIRITGPVREYYIAAEYHQWVYSPLGSNNCTGKPYSSQLNASLAPTKAYRKARFRAYTDASFQVSGGLSVVAKPCQLARQPVTLVRTCCGRSRQYIKQQQATTVGTPQALGTV
jgi:hypothetical protein